jgi:adenine-specific DNA-methyltransferase
MGRDMSTTAENDKATTAAEEPEKLDLRSFDITDEKRAELLGLFPEARTESGKIDFDRLKLALGQSVDVGKERYGMNWPGKADCFRTIQTASVGTLRPVPEESVNFDTTENLIIEGDNLEVLKLLQKSYLNQVKAIYIDPPYNTGNDFIYPDNYAESLETYLEYTGQVDAEGKKFGTNTDANGRFHSKWMNMIYPRLYLARNLLKEDGVILISIDDAEIDNLRKIAAEIFGEENLIANLVWEKGRKNDAKLFSVGHEYLLVYAKSLARLKELKTLWREEKPGAREIWNEYLDLRKAFGADDRKIEAALQDWFKALPKNHPSRKWARYKRVDSNGPWRDRDISWPGGDGPKYDVIHPVTGEPCKVPEAGWRYSTVEDMQRHIKLGLVEFREDESEPPFRKAHLRPIPDETSDEPELDDSADDAAEDEELATQVRGTYFYKQSQVAVKYLRSLMGAKLFDNPKDQDEIAKLLRYVLGNSTDEFVLDFFAGSGTTGEAVMQINADTGTTHKFILVQLPELCNPKERSGKAAIKQGYRDISEIMRDRIRRAGERIGKTIEKNETGLFAEEKPTLLDCGFRSYKLAESNFIAWDADGAKDSAALATQLDLHIDHIRQQRTDDDILYELLLKSGFPLTTPVEKMTVESKMVYSVASGALVICLDRALTLDLVRAIAEMKPERVVCLDEGFAGNDQLKTNAVQTFRTKGITSFRTV